MTEKLKRKAALVSIINDLSTLADEIEESGAEDWAEDLRDIIDDLEEVS